MLDVSGVMALLTLHADLCQKLISICCPLAIAKCLHRAFILWRKALLDVVSLRVAAHHYQVEYNVVDVATSDCWTVEVFPNCL